MKKPHLLCPSVTLIQTLICIPQFLLPCPVLTVLLSGWPIRPIRQPYFFEKMIFYFTKTANIPLYGNIAVYGYVLNCWDTGVYFVPYMCKSSLALSLSWRHWQMRGASLERKSVKGYSQINRIVEILNKTHAYWRKVGRSCTYAHTK